MWLVYFVVVALLAWWPWNAWLLFIGAAYTSGLHRREARRLLAADARKAVIRSPQGIEQSLIASDDLNTALKHSGITGGEHFSDAARNILVYAIAAARSPINQCSIGEGSRIGAKDVAARSEGVRPARES